MQNRSVVAAERLLSSKRTRRGRCAAVAREKRVSLMRTHILSFAAVLCLAACTSTASQPSGAVPDTVLSSGVGGARDQLAAQDGDSDVIAGNESDSGITVAEVPTVEARPVPTTAPKQVCRRTKRTGSHRTERVCYTLREVDASTAGAREVFNELHRQQQLPPIP